MLRPPLAEDRLRRLADGRVRLEPKRAWSEGTTHLLFEPLEFLEKLAALTPRPKINLVLYHGVLAPHARWRPEVVAHRRAERTGAVDPSEVGISIRMGDSGAERPRCSGRMQLIATIDDPAVIQRILAHLGLPGVRDGPPSPSAVSAARAEQRALPYVTR